jgi:hypothetical protein
MDGRNICYAPAERPKGIIDSSTYDAIIMLDELKPLEVKSD